MSEPKELAASIAGRLRNRARELGEDYQRVLDRFALERLLARLSSLPQGDHFVLKGGLLFYQWGDLPRATRDLDLLATAPTTSAELAESFQAVCAVVVEPDDALVYVAETVNVESIRQQHEAGGQRVKLRAELGKSRIGLNIDVGFGDAVVPPDELQDFPVLLKEFPAPNLRVYRRETMVAEKWEAMVQLGAFNSRLKDFFDVWYVSQRFEFDGASLAEAIGATFTARGTTLPSDVPTALTTGFVEEKQTQWAAFLKRVRDEQQTQFETVIERLHEFLLAPTQALVAGRSFESHWPAGGPWSEG